MTKAPKIQLLIFRGCPLADGARRVLEEALEKCGFEEYEEIDILDPNSKEELRFWGSPTILVDGNDTMGSDRGDSVTCRVYQTSDRLPDLETVVSSIRLACTVRSRC